MTATNVRIDSEEDGFYLHVYDDEGGGVTMHHAFRIEDPEALYDAVRAEIGPWLHERELARKTAPTALYVDDSGYDLDDPKHPTYLERMAGFWDNRDKTERKPW